MGLRYFSAHRLILLHICTKFRENISKVFKVIEWTRFPYENSQRGIKKVKKVKVSRNLIAVGAMGVRAPLYLRHSY